MGLSYQYFIRTHDLGINSTQKIGSKCKEFGMILLWFFDIENSVLLKRSDYQP